MSKVHPLGSKRSLLSSSRRFKSREDDANEADMTIKSAPGDGSFDAEDTIRDSIQRLIQKEDVRSNNIEDRSEFITLLKLGQNLNGKTNTLHRLVTTNVDAEESKAPAPLKTENLIPFGIIRPDASFMTYWTFAILVALFYTATFMPYLMSFQDDIPTNWLYVEMSFDCLFMLDIMLNFNIAYYDKYDLIVSRLKIVKYYVTGWLIIDIVASFPFSIISYISSTQNQNEGKLLKIAKVPRVYRIIKIFRILKVIKTAKFLKWYNETMERLNISVTLSRGIKFIIIILCLLHLTSCAWFFVDRLDGFSPNTWVVRNGLEDRDNGDLYLFCIYWALTVLDTIGYGDIVPVIMSERVLCLIWLVFGVTFYSYAISNLSVIFYNMNSRENYIKRKEEYLKEFAQNVKLPKSLLKQVKFYVRYNYRHNVFCWSDMNNFLKELPSELYSKVYYHIFKDVLVNITFFKSKPPAFIPELMPLLKTVEVHEGYELYSYGSPPRDVYFLLKGRVMVKDKNDAVLFSYVKGSYFGEIELLYKTDRKSSIQVEENAKLLKVDGQDFLAVLERFQEVKEEVEEVASKRYNYFLERKKKFKQARKKIDELKKKNNVNLYNSNKLLDDIMKMKLGVESSFNEENEEQDYKFLATSILKNINEIKDKVSEVDQFYKEVLDLKGE